MTAAVVLDEHDVHLMTLALPIDVRLLADAMDGVDAAARKHGLQPAVLLCDGTNRVVARKRGAPERAS